MCRFLTKGDDANVISTGLLTIYIHFSYWTCNIKNNGNYQRLEKDEFNESSK